MIRVFKRDGSWAFEVTDGQGISFSGSGYATAGDAEDYLSRICSSLTAGFRNIIIEE